MTRQQVHPKTTLGVVLFSVYQIEFEKVQVEKNDGYITVHNVNKSQRNHYVSREIQSYVLVIFTPLERSSAA